MENMMFNIWEKHKHQLIDKHIAPINPFKIITTF